MTTIERERTDPPRPDDERAEDETPRPEAEREADEADVGCDGGFIRL